MNVYLSSINTILTSMLSTPQLSGQAYLDPGSGSFILQLLIASLVGTAFLLKTYWRRINGFLQDKLGRKEDDDQENHP